MLCPFCKEKDTSVIDSPDQRRTELLLDEEDYADVVNKGLQLLKECNLEN